MSSAATAAGGGYSAVLDPGWARAFVWSTFYGRRDGRTGLLFYLGGVDGYNLCPQYYPHPGPLQGERGVLIRLLLCLDRHGKIATSLCQLASTKY